MLKDLDKVIGEIDLNKEAPVNEPDRQYYYMAKAKKYVAEQYNTSTI